MKANYIWQNQFLEPFNITIDQLRSEYSKITSTDSLIEFCDKYIDIILSSFKEDHWTECFRLIGITYSQILFWHNLKTHSSTFDQLLNEGDYSNKSTILKDYNHYTSDNYLFCLTTDKKGTSLYQQAYEGCCGRHDFNINYNGKSYKAHFNFGH